MINCFLGFFRYFHFFFYLSPLSSWTLNDSLISYNLTLSLVKYFSGDVGT